MVGFGGCLPILGVNNLDMSVKCLRTGCSVGSKTNCETHRQMTFKTPVLKSKCLPGDNYKLAINNQLQFLW